MNNNVSNLITDSLEFYDTNKDKYESLMSTVKYYDLFLIDDQYSIHLLDADKNLIHKSRYEIIGVLDVPSNIWIWAWAVAYLPKSMTRISRKILQYGTELETDNEFLKTELITSRFKISGEIQIELHTAIASYLSKQSFVINISVGSNKNKEYSMKEKAKEKSYYLFLLDLPN